MAAKKTQKKEQHVNDEKGCKLKEAANKMDIIDQIANGICRKRRIGRYQRIDLSSMLERRRMNRREAISLLL